MLRVLLPLVAFLAFSTLVVSQEGAPCDSCAEEGFVCGPNGIGGSCGTCPAGQSCERGRCVCNRDCTARQCGPDACGNDCGECLPGQTCVNSICTGACTPQCVREVNGAAKTCGWDRCGDCGSCPENFRCRDGICQCYPDCQDKHCGPDGCGGSCGTCDETQESYCSDGTVAGTIANQCYVRCEFCGDGICSPGETSTVARASSRGLEYCPRDCGSVTGIISLAVGQKDQLNGITIDFFNANPYTRNDRELAGFATNQVISDDKGSFGVYDVPLSGGELGDPIEATRVYFRLRGTTSDRTTGDVIPLLDLWWNFELYNTDDLNRSPNFYFYMTPGFTDATALFRVIYSWGNLLSDRASTIPDLDMFVAGPVDSTTMAAADPANQNGIVNFANKNYKSETSSTVLPFAKIVADSAQGFGPEVIDVLKDIRIGADEQSIGLSRDYPDAADEVNEYEFWVDKPNSNSNQDNIFTYLADTNSFIVVYRGESVNPTVINEQIFLGDYADAPAYMFGFYNGDPFNQIPETAASWHVFNLAFSGRNTDTDLTGVSTTNIFEFRYIDESVKWAFDEFNFAPTKSLPCSHTVENGVPGNLAYCPYVITYPRKK